MSSSIEEPKLKIANNTCEKCNLKLFSFFTNFNMAS